MATAAVEATGCGAGRGAAAFGLSGNSAAGVDWARLEAGVLEVIEANGSLKEGGGGLVGRGGVAALNPPGDSEEAPES